MQMADLLSVEGQRQTHPPRKAPIGRFAGRGAVSAIRLADELKLRAPSARLVLAKRILETPDIVARCPREGWYVGGESGSRVKELDDVVFGMFGAHEVASGRKPGGFGGG